MTDFNLIQGPGKREELRRHIMNRDEIEEAYRKAQEEQDEADRQEAYLKKRKEKWGARREGKMSLFELTLESLGLPLPVKEYRFAPPRKWRVDYAWPEQKLAVEIEGGCWVKGRHTRGSGFVGDMEKYNQLTLLGWNLLRFTPQQVKNGIAPKVIWEWFARE